MKQCIVGLIAFLINIFLTSTLAFAFYDCGSSCVVRGCIYTKTGEQYCGKIESDTMAGIDLTLARIQGQRGGARKAIHVFDINEVWLGKYVRSRPSKFITNDINQIVEITWTNSNTGRTFTETGFTYSFDGTYFVTLANGKRISITMPEIKRMTFR